MDKDTVLEIRNLKTYFATQRGILRAVDDVSFKVSKGERLGIVGESGCGKTMTALSIMRLIPYPGRICGGEILFEGKNLLELKEEEMRSVRGRRISIVLQDPFSSMNPVYSIGNQLLEPLKRDVSRRIRKQKVINALGQVGIMNPEARFSSYPFELSGGMIQRCAIAMALLSSPQLLIADEPTTALDVTIQMQVLMLLKRLYEEMRMAMIVITHDLGIIAAVCSRVLVMYSGRIVENGSTEKVLRNPCHPYTKMLLASIPKLDKTKRELLAIPGQPGVFFNPVNGCLFASRCYGALSVCKEQTPVNIETEENHWVCCWNVR